MIKETETEETLGFVVITFIIRNISVGGGRASWPPSPLATPMTR